MERWSWIDPVMLNHQLDCSVVRYLMLPTPIKLSVWILVCSIFILCLFVNITARSNLTSVTYLHPSFLNTLLIFKSINFCITFSSGGISTVVAGSPIAGENYIYIYIHTGVFSRWLRGNISVARTTWWQDTSCWEQPKVDYHLQCYFKPIAVWATAAVKEWLILMQCCCWWIIFVIWTSKHQCGW